MSLRPEVEEQIRYAHHFAGRIAVKIESKYPSILFIALTGAWARGIISPEDIDLVVVYNDGYELENISEICSFSDLDEHPASHITFICYSLKQFRKIVFRQKTRPIFLNSARRFVRLLRQFPWMKKILIALLGSKKSFFQQYEIHPHTIQSYVSLIDRHNVLSDLKIKQKEILEGSLSDHDLILYSGGGFRQIIDRYLAGQTQKQEIKDVLLSSDFDYEEYLRRAVECYDAKDTPLIEELCEYVSKQRH